MCALVLLNYLLLIAFVCNADVLFEDDEPYVGSRCKIPVHNIDGICVPTVECPQAVQELKNHKTRPDICFFIKSEPIICCPPQNRIVKSGTTRISVEKCFEYSRNIPKKQAPGTFHTSVVGGDLTKPGEFPHMTAIGWSLNYNEIDWKCGGTLISENFVVTAAHCITKERPNIIRLSEQNLIKRTAGLTPKDFLIEDFFIHPKYLPKSKYHDIALIKFQGKVELSSSIRPACLWQTHQINYTDAIATGWGNTDFAGLKSDDLLKVDLSLIDTDVCRPYFEPSSNLINGIIDTQICAGSLTENKDTCQGDSGGPLQVKVFHNQKSFYHLIGITSFGKFCASQTPGVYTRISSYIDWIERIVWP